MPSLKEYLEAEGLKCPNCGSDNISAGDPEPDGLTAVSTVGCVDCGAVWEDVYKLVGFRDLKLPD